MRGAGGSKRRLHPAPGAGASIKLLALAALALGACGGEAGPTPAADGANRCEGWTVVQGPALGVPAQLLAVAAVAPDDVWAVGATIGRSDNETLALHWDGAKWGRVPTPGTGFLSAVDGVSATDVWAVGDVDGLIQHWDGRSWSIVPAPRRRGSTLLGVSALAPDDVWAVGHSFSGTTYETLVMHWDGARWRVVPSPNAKIRAAEGFAGGSRLLGVSARAPDDVWAVGGYGAVDLAPDRTKTLILHWDGASWRIVESPNEGGGGMLHGVAAVSATEAWAVGQGAGGGERRHGIIAGWDGTSWALSPTPTIDGFLSDADVRAGGEVWASGNSNGRPVVLRRNGGRWTLDPTPDLEGQWANLSDVSVLAREAWAVGDQTPAGGTRGGPAPLIERGC